jgi:hypothetical protein
MQSQEPPKAVKNSQISVAGMSCVNERWIKSDEEDPETQTEPTRNLSTTFSPAASDLCSSFHTQRAAGWFQ